MYISSTKVIIDFLLGRLFVPIWVFYLAHTKNLIANDLLGTYFNCIMFMVASSVVLTVVVLNYHHRRAEMHDMPGWVSWLIFTSHPFCDYHLSLC